jgi:hypothetical protein
MSRGKQSFRQREITRAVKGVEAAGVRVARIEVDKDGKIIIVTGTAVTQPATANDLDAWMAKHADAA